MATVCPSGPITLTRSVPVRHAVDVFVAGGGPAGVAAAVAAARQGARVYLAEGHVCFGGMGTAGALPMFCNFSDGVNFVAGGVGRDVYEGLFELGGTAPGSSREYRDLLFHGETLKLVYDRLVVAAGVEFTFQTQVIGIEAEGGCVRYAVCHAKSGLFAVRAKAFVDATGDGDLCAWAGAPFEKGDAEGRMQPGTLISLWSGIDWDKANAAGCGFWWEQSREMARAVGDGVFTVPETGFPGIMRTGPASGGGNLGHLFGVDGTDERTVTPAAVQARKMMREYETYFKRYLTGYDAMELVGSAAQFGIRETRRILGDYVLNADDYWRRAVFADEIGRFCYGIDVHAETLEASEERGKEFDHQWLKPGESYGIPYRVLTPRGLDNVLVAGRCVSTDRPVQGSLRVMPGCFITGQAAGVAAALVAQRGVRSRDVAIPELQQLLRRLGAYLPE